VYRTKALLSLAVILSIASASIASNIIYVAANGPNDPGSGTYEDPFHRIQNAIDIAANGDTVQIELGIYTGPGNYNLDPKGKSITICSSEPNNPSIIEHTIIDPNKAGRGFYIHSGEDANCIISGLTVRNGYTNGSGGAIYCYNSSPTLSCCVIIDNAAVWGGGGICCYHSDLSVSNSVIAGNDTNTSGGGIKYSSCSNSRLINCTISSNSANWYGDGIYSYDSNSMITNCIFWANDTEEIYVDSSSPNVNYCDIQGGWPSGIGNINLDPCFVSFDLEGDPAAWDFHLRSVYGRWNSTFYRTDLNNDGIINLVEFTRLADVWLQQGTMPEDLDNSGIVDWMDLELFAQYFLATSQKDGWISDSSTSSCVDAGDPNSDWTVEPWPNGQRINMGAYGGTNQASKSGN
jgi:hypothetical protein